MWKDRNIGECMSVEWKRKKKLTENSSTESILNEMPRWQLVRARADRCSFEKCVKLNENEKPLRVRKNSRTSPALFSASGVHVGSVGKNIKRAMAPVLRVLRFEWIFLVSFPRLYDYYYLRFYILKNSQNEMKIRKNLLINSPDPSRRPIV